MLPGGPGGRIQALGGPDPLSEECGARAGPSTLRLRRTDLTSCILTRGHYDTFQMAVQEPIARKPALQGLGKPTSGTSQAKGNTGHLGQAAPPGCRQCLGVANWSGCSAQRLGLSSLLLSLQPLPQYLPPRHPPQDPRAPHSPRPRPHSGRQGRSARPRPPH